MSARLKFRSAMVTATAVAAVLGMAGLGATAYADPTDEAGITVTGTNLNAEGRTITAYKLGAFDNVTINNNGTADDTSDDYVSEATIASVSDAVKTAVGAAADSADITVASEQDPLIAVASNTDATKTKNFAEALARPSDDADKLTGGITATVNSNGTQATFDGMTEGYYLIVDSNGMTMLQSTAIKSGDQTVTKFGTGDNQITLGAVTIKATSLDVDTKADSKDSESKSIGSTVTYTVTLTAPDPTYAKTWTVTDTLTGASYVLTDDALAVTATVGDAATTLTAKPTLNDKKTGFTLDLSELLTAANKGKTVTLSYQAKTTAKRADSSVTVSGTNKNNTDIASGEDTATITAATIDFTKVSSLNSAAKLAGAKFKIAAEGTGNQWLKWDSSSKTWSKVAENAATEYTTTDEGKLTIEGLGAGTYTVKETAAPAGFTLGDGVSFTVTVGNPDSDGNVSVALSGDPASGSYEVNADGDLPGTTGTVTNTPTLGGLANTGVDVTTGTTIAVTVAMIGLAVGGSVAIAARVKDRKANSGIAA